MGGTENGIVQLPAAEFMAKHAQELAESEQVVSLNLLASIFGEGPIPLSRLVASNATLDTWLQARTSLPGYRLMSDLRKYLLVRLLKAAKKENSPNGYRELLEGWLIRLGVEPRRECFSLLGGAAVRHVKHRPSRSIGSGWKTGGRTGARWRTMSIVQLIRGQMPNNARHCVISAAEPSGGTKHCSATKIHSIKSSRRNLKVSSP